MLKVLKDPLTHFLAVGLGLFVLFDIVASDDASYEDRIIDVNRDTLLTFVQYRTRAFEPRAAAARLDSMSHEELDRLIADYVREEALYREAIALGMDENDYIVKRRMVQSFEFITDGFVTAAVEVSDGQVADYYEANRDDYYVEPRVTFTHVFHSGEQRGRDGAIATAQELLADLNARRAAFEEATRHGDRFPFFVNYVERDPRFVASHFGPGMAEQVFELQPDDATWQGPLESEYGSHLVMLTRKSEGRYPELAEIERAVRADAERAAITEQKNRAIQAIVDTYEVRRTPGQSVISQAQE